MTAERFFYVRLQAPLPARLDKHRRFYRTLSFKDMSWPAAEPNCHITGLSQLHPLMTTNLSIAPFAAPSSFTIPKTDVHSCCLKTEST